MAKLSTKAPGDLVKIRENGALVYVRVLKHGYPINGNGRTLVIRGNQGPEMVWGSSNSYVTSNVDNWLNNTYLNSIDVNIREQIEPVSIQSCIGNGNKTVTNIDRKIFLLSYTELGFSDRPTEIPIEGSPIEYFDSDGKRSIASGALRTPFIRNSGNSSIVYVTNGGYSSSSDFRSEYPVRPAFTLPSDLNVTDDGEVVTNEPPTTPPYISFETPKAGKIVEVTCGASTDPEGDPIDYIFEKQIDSGSWEMVSSGSQTTVSSTIPSSGTKVNFRVKARDSQGNVSAYCTGIAKEIVYNQPPSVPASITFGDPHAGKPLQITCEASTDPDGNPITYIWERQIDSGGWTQIGSGAETSITDTVPSSGTNYNVRVKARDSEGAESGYRTGSAKAIIYNQPPTIPGVPQYKYPIPGEEMPVKWQASADPENGTVTYIVETKLGDGEWTQARETPETSCLVSVPQVSAAGTMIIVRVKAKDQEGAESAYSTGETVEILYHKVIRKIPWQQGKPFKARQYTYNGKKQYQTMREGALAGIEAEP